MKFRWMTEVRENRDPNRGNEDRDCVSPKMKFSYISSEHKEVLRFQRLWGKAANTLFSIL